MNQVHQLQHHRHPLRIPKSRCLRAHDLCGTNSLRILFTSNILFQVQLNYLLFCLDPLLRCSSWTAIVSKQEVFYRIKNYLNYFRLREPAEEKTLYTRIYIFVKETRRVGTKMRHFFKGSRCGVCSFSLVIIYSQAIPSKRGFKNSFLIPDAYLSR